MKRLHYIIIVSVIYLITSCSDKDEPDNQAVTWPVSITTEDTSGSDQSFTYDNHGRITTWDTKYTDGEASTCYSYPNDNTIIIESQERVCNDVRTYMETIHLINGRAESSDGTYIYNIENGSDLMQKTYRLDFYYDTSNHLTSVKHTEVRGIGDDISNIPFNEPWIWENRIIWEDDNIKEFQDTHGNSDVHYTSKFDYTDIETDFPIVYPDVTNSIHHLPLLVRGFFGSISKNLIAGQIRYDNSGNISLIKKYEYRIENNRIQSYYETNSYGTVFSSPILYNVIWTTR